MEEQLAALLSWPRPIRRLHGAAFDVQGIKVYVDFEWENVIGHSQRTFLNHKSLSRYILTTKQNDRLAALLLTDQEGMREGCRTDHETHDIFVVNVITYKSAGRDVASGYFAGLKGSLIFSLGNLSEKETDDLLDRIGSANAICGWMSRHPSAMTVENVKPANVPLGGIATGKLIEELGQRIATLSPVDIVAVKQLLSLPDFPTAILHATELARRQEVVESFSAELVRDEWRENDWQKFFDRERWIFGHGLLYIFLETIEREAYVGGMTIEGRDGRYADYAVRTRGHSASFITLVEIKVPSAQLLGDLYRNRTYGAHKDLSGAISQLVGMCDDWNREGSMQQENMRRALTERWETVCPRGILIVGHTRQLDTVPKLRSFELLRRHLHGLEILTFDELLTRAQELLVCDIDRSEGMQR